MPPACGTLPARRQRLRDRSALPPSTQAPPRPPSGPRASGRPDPAPLVSAGTSSEAWWEAASTPTPQNATDLVPPRNVAPLEPFGATVTTAPPPVSGEADTIARPKRKRSGSRIGGFFRSFGEQPDSYQSATETWPDEEEIGGESIVELSPGNYGRVGLVVLAAAGLLAGAYLPWISGTLGTIGFQQSGFDLDMVPPTAWGPARSRRPRC